MRVLSVTSLPLRPALVWAHPHKFGLLVLIRLGDSMEQQPARQNNSFAWLVRLIRVYFLLFPVSLYAFTVLTELRQVRHCVICRLLHPVTSQVQAVTCSVQVVTCSVQELVRIYDELCTPRGVSARAGCGVVWCVTQQVHL